jgi:hypothetical protein
MSEITGNQLKSFVILLKHFVKRFVYSDMIKSENHRRETVLILTIALTGIGGYVAYDTLSQLGDSNLGQRAWMAKTYYITLMMMLTGIVSLISWDNALMDRKDLANLLHLPIKTGALTAAKLAASFTFVFLISAAFDLLAIFVFTGQLADKLNINPVYFFLCHFFTLLAANLSVFLFFTLFQGVLMLLFNEKWLKRFSIFFKTLFLGVFMSSFAWFPPLYNSLPQLKQSYSPVIYRYPPLWFVGLNETLTGNSGDAQFAVHSQIAFLFLSIVLMLYLLIASAGYRRIINDNGGGKASARLLKPPGRLIAGFNSLFLKNPTEEAIFFFVSKTLKRNWEYKAHLVVYAALPAGFMISRLVYLHYNNLQNLLYTIDADTLSIAIALGSSLAVGLRTIVLHPDKLEANWLFQVTDINHERHHYIDGLKKALVVCVFFPVLLVLFLFYWYSWGILSSFYHCLYVFFLTRLTLEALFFNYKKIPFTSAYIGGKINLKFWWPLVLAGFVGYVVVFSRLEQFLMAHPRWFAGFYALVYGIIFSIGRWRKTPGRRFEFIFEEEPEPAMASLDFTS